MAEVFKLSEGKIFKLLLKFHIHALTMKRLSRIFFSYAKQTIVYYKHE